MGLGDEIGSLEVGKQADLILVELTALNLSPVLEAPVCNIVPNLVYAASGHEVKTAVVAGQVLMRDREQLKGTIEVGKLADRAVLDRDYFAVANEEIKEIQIDATIVNGKVVWERM